MTYDFDELIPRRGTGSFKWDAAEDSEVLPLWVADMDFRAPPSVLEALERRVRHGVFGYAKAPPAYFEAVVSWFRRRHGFTFAPEQLLPTTGVVPALAAIVRALCKPGERDGVIVQPPVYNHFFDTLRGQGCAILENDLVYRDGIYRVDFADLEAKASDPRAKLLVLCHPHNPVGRVWTVPELIRIGEICLAHDVIVISDEIHCDLVHEGHRHVPFASLRDDFARRSVTCTSPSKTFNLAGLQVANLLVPDDELRRTIHAGLHANEITLVSPLAIEALIAAYGEGDAWLTALKSYLLENYRYPLRGFSPAAAAALRPSARGALSRLGGLLGAGAKLGRSRRAPARAGQGLGQRGTSVRSRRRGLPADQHRLPAEPAGRWARALSPDRRLARSAGPERLG